MKKIAKLSMLVLIVLLVAATAVSAATKADLKANVEALVKKLNLERSYTKEINQFFDSDKVDFNDDVVAKLEQTLNKVDTELAKYDYDTSKVSKEVKEDLLETVQAAASDVGLKVTVDYSNKNLLVTTEAGEEVVTVSYNTNLAQTGNNNLVFAGLAVVAVIAVAATVVVNKARANA